MWVWKQDVGAGLIKAFELLGAAFFRSQDSLARDALHEIKDRRSSGLRDPVLQGCLGLPDTKPSCAGSPKMRMNQAGLNMIIDPSGKLLTRRKVVTRKVTKFKTLSRRARSSRQVQLRQMKEELAPFLNGDDSEEEPDSASEDDCDDGSALESLATHETVDDCSTVTPSFYIPALSPDMQLVLGKLQARQRQQDAAACEPVKNEKPQKDRGEAQVKMWAKDDADAAPVEGCDDQGGKKKEKSAVAKKPKQNHKSPAGQEVSKKTASHREEKQPKEEAKVCDSGDTEAMARMKRDMSEDCAYVPGSYKE
ncbi:unnamed protein product, partial [Symbiodinium necroappetens]